jgi:hypothetical protein
MHRVWTRLSFRLGYIIQSLIHLLIRQLSQGDVSYDVEEILAAPKGKDAPILKGVPEDNIEVIEEKKKKSSDD